MADITVVSTNTAPDINAVLPYDDGSGPVDLTSATVKFQMRRTSDKRFTVNAAASVIGSPTNGQVRYSWGPNDLNIPGLYQSQWEVVFPGGRRQTSTPPNLIEVRAQ